MSKKLLIDAGNSSLKWALLDSLSDSLFEQGHPPTFARQSLSEMESVLYIANDAPQSFNDILDKQMKVSDIDTVVMVSVLGDKFSDLVKASCLKHSLELVYVKSVAQLAGVTVAYQEPYKLGTDRLVAMVAAHQLVEGQACIVVDSGTATTIDALDAQGQHLGGVILSGLDLCNQSLLKNTELLASHSESKDTVEATLFSTNTKQAILSGSLFGLAGAIDTICLNMEKEIQSKAMASTKVKKIICGGSAKHITPYLSENFLLEEDLVMQGLKIILETKQP